MSDMKRRVFITLIGGAAAWPLAARAQESPIPVIGFIRNTTRDDSADLLKAMHQGLTQTGYVEGRNVAVGSRSGPPSGRRDRRRRRCFIICGQGSNDNHSDHFFDRLRPNRNRPRDQPEPTGR
jgi:hypothetical protein